MAHFLGRLGLGGGDRDVSSAVLCRLVAQPGGPLPRCPAGQGLSEGGGHAPSFPLASVIP